MSFALEPVTRIRDLKKADQSVALWFLGLQDSEDCRAYITIATSGHLFVRSPPVICSVPSLRSRFSKQLELTSGG
jgi:hypothetical protein